MTKQPEYIWFNGQLTHWQNAQVHVLTHAIHYGSSVFEGIRSYDTPQGPVIFRLEEHIKRLYNSAKLYRMPINYTHETLIEACRQVLIHNHLTSAYLRPVAFFGCGGLGVLPKKEHPVEIAIAAFEWGAYLGEDSLTQGVDVGVSSWNRVAPNTIPTAAKAGGNYLSSQLVAAEAQRHGYVEGIALDTQGFVSEGSGENIFIVNNGKLYTPPETAAILPGLTRDAVTKLARRSGYEVIEAPIAREALYLADEVFMTGTAAEIVPVRSVDGLPVGEGRCGKITKALQDEFFGLFSLETEDEWNWLTPVFPESFSSQVA